MNSKQQGFTLIELVVVIVILGILAAVAIPRYVGYTAEARTAAINGLAGALRSSVALVQGRYIALNNGVTPVALLDGTTVAVSVGVGGGVPTTAANGIGAAVNVGTPATFVYDPGTGVWNFPTAIANCNVTYAATGSVTVNAAGCGAI
jgi:MSHA pilin protein MshA